MHPTASPTLPRPPSREAILGLPVFPALGLPHIHVPVTQKAQEHALALLLAEPYLGFDTEARPAFVKGEPARGPDVVQFATRTEAYVLPLNRPGMADLAAALLTASVAKVGFGLANDKTQLIHRFGTAGHALTDIDELFADRGYGRNLGVRGAVALLFQQRLLKSRRVTTSNWARHTLEDRQILYAGNDAYAACHVYAALLTPRAHAHDSTLR